eukprot:5968446-Pleurochrysis_carterae.AAC.1
MAGGLRFLLASLLAFIAYQGIMQFFFEGEAAVAISPYLALAIAAMVYSSIRDPFLVPKLRPAVWGGHHGRRCPLDSRRRCGLFDLLWTIAESLRWGQMSLGGSPSLACGHSRGLGGGGD